MIQLDYLLISFCFLSQLSQSVRVKLKDFETQLMNDTTLTEDEKQAKLKAEKIKIALEKLKKARVQKVNRGNCTRYSQSYCQMAVGAVDVGGLLFLGHGS